MTIREAHVAGSRTEGDRDIHVLVVDDDGDFVDSVSSALEDESDRLSVATATSIAGALEALRSREFDCLVCDYDMPEMDGLTFFETIETHHSELPFILFTDEGSENVASRAISQGVTDYLRQSGNTDQFAILANRIENAVDAHRSQVAAQYHQRRLQTLISNLPGIVYRCRNERGWPMAFVGGDAEQLCGYTADRLESHDVLWGEEIIHPEDRDHLWDSVQDALDAGDPFEASYRIVTADGDRRWVWERGRGIVEDEEIVALEGFITDVTDRRERARAIESLHESTRTLMACESSDAIADTATEALVELLDMPNAGIYYFDPDDIALIPSSWAETVEHHVGTPPPLDEDSLPWEVYRTGESRIYDDLERGIAGNERVSPYTSALMVPIGDHGVALVVSLSTGVFDADDRQLVEVLCANVASALDRLDREQALCERERALERENERLDRFVSLASHDLRNPLDAAQLRLELAQRECDSEHLDVVERSHDRMATLLSDLLSLARTGESVSDRTDLHLGDLVRRCSATIDTSEMSLDIDADVSLRADESRLSELFENLLRNALEHGTDGPDDEVTVSVGTLEDGFYVADDGPGIPADEREQVFEAGHSTDKRSTGFGLSIVREIVRAHGWSIEVTESAAGGARFEITAVDVSA